MNSMTTEILNVTEAAEQRRSIRAFKQEPIPRADLLEILRLTRLAPSSANLQPWRFLLVEKPELKRQLAAVAFNQKQVMSAPTVIVLYTDMADTLANLDEVFHPGMDEGTRERMRGSILRMFEEKSALENEAFAAGQGNIALGFLLLIAEAHGYQTSPMLGFDPDGVKALLTLPAHVQIPALVAIGKGVETGFPHHRHDLARIVRFAL